MPPLLNNRYKIIQTLGSGGFGNTFLAEDTHMPSGRRCAIKQLKPIANDPQMFLQAQTRFQREAAILEDLGEGSNQIPKLYAYFSEAGQFYLVQEFIEGQTLTKKVQAEGVLSEKAVKDILVSLLPVLDFVHSKRMIHRDIKPDNIIIRQRDGKPVLIDFGAVKESVGAGNTAVGNAVASMVIGTPGFMPSEQGVGHPVFASDLYSLALTAIYLLTGKLPQDLQSDPRTGEILWHQYASNLSPGFTAVLDKAIQSHPRDRFSTAREMLDALQSSAAFTPTPALSDVATVAVSPGAGANIPPTPVYPQTANTTPPAVGQPQQRNPLLIGLLIAFGLVSAAVAGTVVFTRNQQSPDPVASSSPRAEEPIPRQTQPTPSPTPDNSPVTRDEPTPSVAIAPTPTPEPVGEPEPVQTAEPEPVREPEPAPTPEPARPTPEPARPTPEPARPTPEPENNNPAPNVSTSVPTFQVGTARSDIQAALGKPSRDVSGLWRTRAVIYEVVPDQIDLGYLFDRTSGRLRQTEVSFADSVDPQTMSTTLNGLLPSGASPDIRQGLRQVQRGRRSSYTFTQGNLRGMIVRQDCNVIYISIWDADLHEFNVSSARKC
jgi:serine/threonine-protein kinase